MNRSICRNEIREYFVFFCLGYDKEKAGEKHNRKDIQEASFSCINFDALDWLALQNKRNLVYTGN